MMQSSLPGVSLVFLNLQIIQGLPQVKTPMGRRAVFTKFFRFQTIGARLACLFHDGLKLAAALLAAIAIISISLSLEAWIRVGVDFGCG
jgi:hypothetical protein